MKLMKFRTENLNLMWSVFTRFIRSADSDVWWCYCCYYYYYYY